MGFSYGARQFRCADGASLDLHTAMLIFVPSLLLFTVTPTCDYCLFVMSLIFPPRASLPLPFNFGRKIGTDGRNLTRIGIGSLVHDHTSFCQVIGRKRLPIPPMARRYRDVRRLSPKKIFLVDFESVWRSEKGLPLCPIEVTVRDGNGDVIISCIINDEGATNSALEDALRDLGYSDEKGFYGVRRIRGPQ